MTPRPRRTSQKSPGAARSAEDERTEQTPAPKPGEQQRPDQPGAPAETEGQREEGTVGPERIESPLGDERSASPEAARMSVRTSQRPSSGEVREAKPGEERDPALGALTMPDEGQFDQEHTTAFDWIGDPPDLWWDQKTVIERPDIAFHKRVDKALRTDGRMRAVEAAITLPLRMATPEFEMPDDDAGQTEFVKEALLAPVEAGGMRTPLAEFVGQVANALVVRRSFHEKVFTKRSDGRVVYKKLGWRPYESCEVWRDPRSAEIIGFRQYQYLDEKGKPIWAGSGSKDELDKHDPTYRTVRAPYAFIYTHGKHRDPINGVSDMDVAVWAHEMKIKVVGLWYAFLDGQATPRVAVYGKDKTEVERRARAMAALRGGGVAGFIRNGADENVFDAIESQGTGSTAFQEMIRWLDNVQSESVMAGHLGLTGGATEGRGSLALSSDASSLYQASRDGIAREVADAITADIVAPLVALNFGVGTSVPRFKFESADVTKMTQVMEMFGTFATAGSLQIPTEFMGLLLEMVAAHLDLPADRVEQMVVAHEQAIADGRAAAAALREQGIDPDDPEAAAAGGPDDESGPPGTPTPKGEDPESPEGQRNKVGDRVDAAIKVVNSAKRGG